MTGDFRVSGAFSSAPGVSNALILSAALLFGPGAAEAQGDGSSTAADAVAPVVLIGLGDSLTHGTMDATNNRLNSLKSFLQRVASSLSTRLPVHFQQPFFDVQEQRIQPFRTPTNLGVDGSDSFSMAGIEYGKRVGSDQNMFSFALLSEQVQPSQFSDDYDKVIYPINLLARRPMSQIGAASWLLGGGASDVGIQNAPVTFWIGNNDSSGAALGLGGKNPEFFPLPLDQIAPELKPELRLLLEVARSLGLASYEPYLQSAIERNLTDVDDFEAQFNSLLDRLALADAESPANTRIMVLTLPYYSAVGYLMDSEDIEYYLRKIDPGYSVPAGFERVAPDGEPIVDYLNGDRISLLTFGLLYTLLSTGHTPQEVNQVLEQDGLVLSEAEAQFVMARIDAFNQVIREAVASRDERFRLVDIGPFLNQALAGDIEIIVNGRRITRKWIRGGAFSFDGVHPGYVGQAVVANFVLGEINAAFGLNAPVYDLSPIQFTDPYVDRDGDGWAAGPGYQPTGINQFLFLFSDPNDGDPAVQAVLPPNVWDFISDILLGELLSNAQIREEARRRGLAGVQ
jgi:hypothetical protein